MESIILMSLNYKLTFVQDIEDGRHKTEATADKDRSPEEAWKREVKLSEGSGSANGKD